MHVGTKQNPKDALDEALCGSSYPPAPVNRKCGYSYFK